MKCYISTDTNFNQLTPFIPFVIVKLASMKLMTDLDSSSKNAPKSIWNAEVLEFFFEKKSIYVFLFHLLKRFQMFKRFTYWNDFSWNKKNCNGFKKTDT
jgi:hypothetical protein